METIGNKLRIKHIPVKESRISNYDMSNLPFGKVFADYMLEVDYTNGEWNNVTVKPYERLNLSPACSALHYGQSIFEGLKAYKSENNDVYVFRIDSHWERMNNSAERMCMPEIPKDIFIDGIKYLLSLNKEWVPKGREASMYIRPLFFATDEYVGIRPSLNYKFIVFCSPITGGYYNSAVKVKIETKYTRACKGGTGTIKAAGNYAASLYPAKLAQDQGYHQLIWTDYLEHKYIEESGTMNIMFVIDDILITPELSDTILAGITRDSIITIAKDWGWKIEERKISIDEIINAFKKNKLNDAFGMGTAVTIAPIELISYNNIDYVLAPVEKRYYSNKLKNYLEDLRTAKIEDKFGWLSKIN